MFRSSSFHTLDPKGRIIIPARFREIVRGSGKDGIMVSNMDGGLYAYTFDKWETIEKKILSAKSRYMRQFKRFFLGNACECMCDKQGRILLPPSLREYAGLERDPSNPKETKEVVLVGVLDHFEIWLRERWERENLKMEEEMKKEEVQEEIASLGL